jgi:hypothetical protein
MGRVPRYCYALLMLLLAPRLASAIQLHWNDGTTSRTFTEATRCTLVVQADSIEQHLPSEWRLLWAADSTTDVNPIPLSEQSACVEAVAQISAVDEPATSADSAAHLRTAHFCSDENEPLATTARYMIDLPETGAGKFKAVALDPNDSTQVIESNEVTFNGGVDGEYSPVILSTTSTHSFGEFGISIGGAELAGTSSLSIVALDSSWSLPLSITRQSGASVTAVAPVAAPVPACLVQVTAPGGVSASAPLAADPAYTPLAPLSAPSPMVEHFQSDPVDTVHMQPKDFSMTWAYDGMHVFYIRHDMATIQKYGTNLGTKYTEKNLGHAWTPDFVTWHWDSLPRDTTVLQVDTLSTRWDNWHVWAPCIVRKANDITYRMFYTGVQRVGGVGGVENQSIGVATSTDLVHWNRTSAPVLQTTAVPWAKRSTSLFGVAQQLRDPFVMEHPSGSGHYLMYFVAVVDSASSDMAVGVARSSDLNAWEADSLPLASTQFAAAESPHVFPDSSRWWLFFTTENDPVRLQTTDLAHSPADSTATDWSPIPAQRLFDYLYQDSTVAYWHATEHLVVASHEYLAAYDDLHMAVEFSELIWYPTPGQSNPYHFALGSASTASVEESGSRPGATPLGLITRRLRPGSPNVELRVELSIAAQVRLQIYDVMGRRCRTLIDKALPAGATDVTWDGRDESGARAASGVYFARLTCGRAQRVVRFPLVR